VPLQSPHASIIAHIFKKVNIYTIFYTAKALFYRELYTIGGRIAKIYMV